jgi:siroheme synthase (precorrin-2 oxidase/ferrochelatase)
MKKVLTPAQVAARKKNFAKFLIARDERRRRWLDRVYARDRYEWLKAEILKQVGPQTAELLNKS